MEIIDNINRLLGDDLKQVIQPGATLKIAACDEKSAAYEAGYKTISEIAKELIRRAGTAIKNESAITNPDTGFRVLKIDTSNMKVYYLPEAIQQDQLTLYIDNIKADRTQEDLLFQVLVDWGVHLALPIERQTIAGKTVFFVERQRAGGLLRCRHRRGAGKELAKCKPLRAVFRDSGYASDSTRINVEQIFKLLSPDAEAKSL